MYTKLLLKSVTFILRHIAQRIRSSHIAQRIRRISRAVESGLHFWDDHASSEVENESEGEEPRCGSLSESCRRSLGKE